MLEYTEEEGHKSTWTKPQKAIKYKIEGDCHICTSHKPGGPGYPRIRRGNTLHSLHRYIWEKYNYTIPKGLCIRHTCDNKLCINPKHLLLGTLADNNKDAMERGQHKRGEDSYLTKLKEKDVLFIRENLHLEDWILAKKFKVHKRHISKIKRGEIWKHLLPEDFKPIDRRLDHSARRTNVK